MAAAAAAAAASVNLSSSSSSFKSSTTDCLSSAGNNIAALFFYHQLPTRLRVYRASTTTRCSYGGNATDSYSVAAALSPNGSALSSTDDGLRLTRVSLNSQRKTKIVCTIGPSTSTRDMIWKLAEAGMNVARLNMSHGDHASHQKTIDLVKEYNAQFQDKVVSIMLDTRVLRLEVEMCHSRSFSRRDKSSILPSREDSVQLIQLVSIMMTS